MQTRMLGAVACVSPAHPPNQAAGAPLSSPCALLMLSAAAFVRGVCKGQKSEMQGCGRHAWKLGCPAASADRIPFGWQLPYGGMRGRPLGALRRHEMVCGAHERPPGRMWRPGIGFGFRSSNSSVHPDARKLALECVSTADMGGACRRRASPPSRVCGVRARDRDAGFGAAGACVESVVAGRAPHGTPGAACGGIKAPAGSRGAVAAPVKAVAPWRAVEGAGCCANLSGGGVEGRHRSFQIPRDGAPLGFRAGRVELDQIGGWCRLVLGFRPQWERVRLVDRPFVVDFRVPLKRDGVPLNDNSHRLSKGHR